MHSPSLLKFPGVSLPVFDSDEPLLCTKAEMMGVVDDPSFVDTFIRRVRFVKPGKMTMDHFLEVADAELEVIARLSGGTALGHTWGLYDIRGKPSRPFTYGAWDGCLPQDHILAARVSIVDRSEPGDVIWDVALKGILTYINTAGRTFSNVNLGQFIDGMQRPNVSSVEPAPIMVDIEPF